LGGGDATKRYLDKEGEGGWEDATKDTWRRGMEEEEGGEDATKRYLDEEAEGGGEDATKRYLDEEEEGGGEGRMLLKDTWRMVYIDICNFLVLSRYFSSSQT